MREYDATKYAATKEALKTFLETFKKEIRHMVYEWSEIGIEAASSIFWTEPGDNDDMYGTVEGMYISAAKGDYCTYLKKTTEAYVKLINAMFNLLNVETLTHLEVMLSFDGKEYVTFRCVTRVEAGLNIVKTITKEFINMLSDVTPVEFYEGDDEPNNDKVYNPAVDDEPANYYVGFKGTYNIWEV